MSVELDNIIQLIKNAKLPGENTAVRVGTSLEFLNSEKANKSESFTKSQTLDLINQVKALMVTGSNFIGSIKPTSTIPTGDVWGFAQAGTYPNANGIVIPSGSFGIISRIGNTWDSVIIEADINSIENIEKTNTSGLVDTYTIYMSNGTTFEFEVINGENLTDWSAKTYPEKSSVIYDDSIYRVKDGQTALANDIPGASDKWVVIGGKDEKLNRVLKSFLKGEIVDIIPYDSSTAIKGTLKADGTIVNSGSDANNKILNVDLNDASLVEITAHPFQSSLSEYAMFVGLKSDGSKMVLLPAQPDSSVLKSFSIDVQDYVSGQICYNYSNEEDKFLVKVSISSDMPEEDSVKNFIEEKTDPVESVLKYFLENAGGNPVYENQINYESGYVENGNIINNPEYRTYIIDNTDKKLVSLRLTGARINSTNPSNAYVSGLDSNGNMVTILTANSGGLIVDNNFILDYDFSLYETIMITMYMTGQIVPKVEAYFGQTNSEDSVKNYIDSFTINNPKSKLDLYALGLRENKSASENTAIFNSAFQQGKAEKRNLKIPAGIYNLNNVLVRGGVGFEGEDKNTILRSVGSSVFNYTASEAQSYIEANQLGVNEYSNQGVEIGGFILSGNGVGQKGMILNNMAYSKFERLYMTGFTDTCLDMKGVLLCNFYDVQFTKSVNGVKNGRSENGLFWANLVNFENCKWRYLTGIALDWDRGAGLHLVGCDLSAIGTSGNINTGVIKLRNMSIETPEHGLGGIDISMFNCWSEQLFGGFYLDMQNCAGRSLLNIVNIKCTNLAGAGQTVGINNDGAKVRLTNGNMLGFGTTVKTLNGGVTKVSDFEIASHTETNGGQFLIV